MEGASTPEKSPDELFSEARRALDQQHEADVEALNRQHQEAQVDLALEYEENSARARGLLDVHRSSGEGQQLIKRVKAQRQVAIDTST